ncbi:MAG: hypothetical protein RLZZ630_1324 [Bacteroidota bacterium]
MSSNQLQFLFRGKLVSLDLENKGIPPTTTVLRFLRESGLSNGTKEGCAEGDCGACTVVVAEPDALGRLRYHAVDSCLMFLPMLHGKQLITVEDLEVQEQLHPVQQAMIDCNGTQCGYCTPGFIMSLFASSKNRQDSTDEELRDALTGNLCRCTGYKPILAAAGRCVADPPTDKFDEEEKQTLELLEVIDQKSQLELALKNQKYFRPASLQKALSLLAQHAELIPMAGATDVALRVTKKRETLTGLLDLGGIKELQFINRQNNRIDIGAGVSLEKIRIDLRAELPALTNMLDVFGSRQIRTLATLGGNIGSASPIGDMLPVLMAYEADVVVQNLQVKRTIPLIEFITGYRTTQRNSDELITQVSIPLPSPHAIIRSYKVSKRRDLDISTLSGAFRISMSGGLITSAILAFGGMAAKTERAEEAEAYLLGKPWTRSIAEDASELVRKRFQPLSDARSGAEFRRIASGNLILKFWNDTRP